MFDVPNCFVFEADKLQILVVLLFFLFVHSLYIFKLCTAMQYLIHYLMLKNILMVGSSFHEVIFINCKIKGRYWLLKSPISFDEADVGCLEC